MKFIQGARRWAADIPAENVVMSVVARADVMLNFRMPGGMARQMCADVGKDAHLGIILAEHEDAVIHARSFPTIDLGAGEFEKFWNT